jgi:CheY-like chemotaxis protein
MWDALGTYLMAMLASPNFTTHDESAENHAEGHPDLAAREALDIDHVHTMPALRCAPVYSLASETGMVAAVMMAGESAETDDEQDALRVTDESLPQRSAQSQFALELADMNGIKALIIEDSAEVADVITVILQRMGLVTAHESHGVRAFERFNEMRPHLVMLDLSLPDITGWRVLDAIREQCENDQPMPIVIVLTAYGDPANRLVGKLQNVHAYLVKPFTADELVRVVREAMSVPR